MRGISACLGLITPVMAQLQAWVPGLGLAMGAAALLLALATVLLLLRRRAATARPASGSNSLQSTLADDARFAPLLATYVEALPAQREAIARAREVNDRQAVAELIHRLHGTGSSFGFPAISQVAGACEAAIRGGAALEHLADLDALDRLLASVAVPGGDAGGRA